MHLQQRLQPERPQPILENSVPNNQPHQALCLGGADLYLYIATVL
jgi:hypothetical protein